MVTLCTDRLNYATRSGWLPALWLRVVSLCINTCNLFFLFHVRVSRCDHFVFLSDAGPDMLSDNYEQILGGAPATP